MTTDATMPGPATVPLRGPLPTRPLTVPRTRKATKGRAVFHVGVGQVWESLTSGKRRRVEAVHQSKAIMRAVDSGRMSRMRMDKSPNGDTMLPRHRLVG